MPENDPRMEAEGFIQKLTSGPAILVLAPLAILLIFGLYYYFQLEDSVELSSKKDKEISNLPSGQNPPALKTIPLERPMPVRAPEVIPPEIAVPPLPPVSEPGAAALAELERLGARRIVENGFKASWSPDGKRIVFGRGIPSGSGDDASGIAILDLATNETTHLVTPGKDPSWSTDGRSIAYITGYGQSEVIWLVEPTGGAPRKLAVGGFPTWSADGKTLYFQSRGERKLMSVLVDAATPTPVEVLPMVWWYPAPSPDGGRVAYRAGDQLVVADLKTNEILVSHLLPGRARGFLAGWSPDGKKLGFGGYGFQDSIGLIVLDVASGKLTQLTPDSCTMPAWSPDGSRIAFDFRQAGKNEIWLLETKALASVKASPATDLRSQSDPRFTASSSWNNTTLSAHKAFDGDPRTRWNSASSNDQGAWIAATWKEPAHIGQVTVRQAFDRITGLKIQCLDNASGRWVTAEVLEREKLLEVKSGKSGMSVNDGDSNPVFKISLPQPVLARGVRVVITSVFDMGAIGTVSIWEIETDPGATP